MKTPFLQALGAAVLLSLAAVPAVEASQNRGRGQVRSHHRGHHGHNHRHGHGHRHGHHHGHHQRYRPRPIVRSPSPYIVPQCYGPGGYYRPCPSTYPQPQPVFQPQVDGVYNLQCTLEENETVQGITSVNVNITEFDQGGFQVTGSFVDSYRVSRGVNTSATGTFEDDLTLVLASGGEITLTTETDEEGEEFMTGKITFPPFSDDEGLVCFVEEVEN